MINRNVYAVKKALIEFDHALIATLDDHRFEAGLKDGDTSYLAIDGRIIAEKTRIF
ncbi:MAG: hypothetical protein IJW46_05985 [Clostridia bacterium]|nr:hypothetical protein [Clostridia bacterium]